MSRQSSAPFAIGSAQVAYADRALSVERSSMISYLPLWETAGAVADDLSHNGFDGASVGVTLGEQGIGDGRTSYGFDGATDYVNWYSAGLAAAFNGAEGTLGPIWLKFPAAAWTDGLFRTVVRLTVDGNNDIYIRKHGTNGLVQFVYAAGGVFENRSPSLGSPTSWFPVTMTWSKTGDVVNMYGIGGALLDSSTVLGTWSGALTLNASQIGAHSQAPIDVFSGNIQHVPLRNKALTAAQIAYLSKP